MPYDETIPQAGDLLSQSQAELLENFAQIKTLIDINHQTFGHADQGKHLQTTFPVRAADPVTAANEVALYCKDNGAGAASLFFKPENQGIGATEYDFTTATQAVTGECTLPSGIALKWGTATIAVGHNSIAVAWAPADHFPTAILRVLLTPNTTFAGLGTVESQIVSAATKLVSGFTVYRSQHAPYQTDAVSFDYLAIGY